MSRRYVILILFVAFFSIAASAKNSSDYKVSYGMGGGPGGHMGHMGPMLSMRISGSKVIISREEPKGGPHHPEPPFAFRKERPTSVTYIDYSKNEWYKTETFPDSSVYTVITQIKKDIDFQVMGTDTILDYPCKHIRTSVNSNSIDIWYTDKLKVKGTPQPELGYFDGIVMKIARNGHTGLVVRKIEKIDSVKKKITINKGKIVSKSELKYLEDKLQVKEVEIFSGERIAFTGNNHYDSFDKDIVYRVGGGTVIMKKVTLPENRPGNCIFAEITQFSDGDAYDRTGSIFLIPTDKAESFLDAIKDSIDVLPAPFVSDTTRYPGIVSTDNYSVPVELVRFFTSFGVRKYNYQQVWGQQWADSVVYKQEITHYAKLLKGEVWIAAYIGNWDQNGHILSLKFKYYPEEDSRSSNVVLPVFNTLNMLEQAGQKYPSFMNRDSLHMTFNVDKPMKNAKLVYITTGHGGWGNGDEFNQKLNRIFFDGKLKFAYIPWRSDCSTYRSLNPCSGNFSNGLSSSDYSRSNWCPGTLTQPAFIPLGDIDPGNHEIVVSIDQGDAEGSSISYWCISGTIISD